MSTASAYRALIVAVERAGHDARGNFRYRVTYRTALDNVERSANTRGYLTDVVRLLTPGSRANLIRDGRGSIIAIDRTD